MVPELAAFLWCAYGFFMSVVLLTLLVAIMNDTYHRIQDAEDAEVRPWPLPTCMHACMHACMRARTHPVGPSRQHEGCSGSSSPEGPLMPTEPRSLLGICTKAAAVGAALTGATVLTKGPHHTCSRRTSDICPTSPLLRARVLWRNGPWLKRHLLLVQPGKGGGPSPPIGPSCWLWPILFCLGTSQDKQPQSCTFCGGGGGGPGRRACSRVQRAPGEHSKDGNVCSMQ